MKLRKMMIAFVGLSLSCLIFAGNTFAADTWAVCTPKKIGPYGDYVLLMVKDCNVDPTDGNPNGWMILSSTGTDQMMATILTAMSLNKSINVAFNNATKANNYNVAKAIIFAN